MPVRIYDIAKKLGLESKEVLAKAKELGIASARVASSSLDKITAEYLESHFTPAKPVAPPAPPPPAPEPIVIVSAPPEAPPPQITIETTTESVTVEVRAEPTEAPAGDVPTPDVVPPVEARTVAPVSEAPVEPVAPAIPEPPAEPEPPRGPKVGDLVGRISLPPKPGPKPPPEKPPQRPPPTPPGRPEARGRFDQQRPRTFGGPPSRFGQPAVTRPLGTQLAKPAGPAAPVLPDSAQIITIKPPIIVRELAEKLNRKPHQVIADLVGMNVWATVNQAIDETIAQRVCAKYGFKFEVEKRKRDQAAVTAAAPKEVEIDTEDKVEDLKPRPPVVTIMGHVDHGKTSLLDVIRRSDVVAGEAGGITQHIGAYTIAVPHPERKTELAQITFLDTPGHAAFSAMRARGANVTDIVVLVVAANDGVMPQTVEALNHAKAANVPIIVAVNKIDHPNANSLKVRQQLQEKGLVPDDWGGDTIFVDVSAIAKTNIDKLLEMILLQADLLELKANPNRRAKGNVIESGLSPGGPTATVLVRKGTLKVSDVIICGQYWGRVRALINEEGTRLKEASPSVAAKCLGLNGVPEPGSEFVALEDEKSVREIGENRAMEARAAAGEARAKVTLENLFDTLAASKDKILKVVCKADAQGSVEAIVEALKKLDTEKVSIELIHSAVGTITESDVHLASASNAIIIGFHTRLDVGVADVAKREGVQIKLYAIIYELIDQVKEAMAGLLDPVLKENVIGSADVKKVFELSKGGKVAGCIVSNGRIVKGKVRVMRRKNLIYEGILNTLRRFQDDVSEVRAGMECGIRVDGFSDFQVGDSIESYVIEKVAQKM